MAKKLRVVLAQLDFLVGDVQGNLQKHLLAVETARTKHEADIILFPELSLTGYPPEDLLLRKDFIHQTQTALQEFTEKAKGIYSVIGHPHATSHGLYNACSLIHNGTILGRYSKEHLPNYGIFDEDRYFVSGNIPCVIPVEGIPVGLLICEDVWFPGPIQQAATQGARVILVANASPFEKDKHERRLAILSKQAKQHNVSILYVNLIGGQDEIVFDGGSMAINEHGDLCQLANFFAEGLYSVDIDIHNPHTQIEHHPIQEMQQEEKIYQALVMGVRDYINKNRFKGGLIGVSGGIDSALTLSIAVDALGKERVRAILMPSRYTADISLEDGIKLAKNLGVKYEIISIEQNYQSFLESLEHLPHRKKPSIAEENIQARCRAVILMALSNRDGTLVLATGNRSEFAVGYCTLYGDMAGGFAVLKDIPKTLVYQLANYRNALKPIIPQRIIDRPPTAELSPGQLDQDLLPPYSILDPILNAYLNHEDSIEEIIEQGYDPETVKDVVKKIYASEYKRRQAPIGVRINNKAFGRDRRYPITSGFKG